MVLRGTKNHCKQNTYPGSGINQGPIPQEAANHFHLPSTCCHMQCSFSTLQKSKSISVASISTKKDLCQCQSHPWQLVLRPIFLPAETLASTPGQGVSMCHCTWECLGLPAGQSQTNIASTTERQNENPSLGEFCQTDLSWSHISLSILRNTASAHVQHEMRVHWACLSLGIARHKSLKMEGDDFPDGPFLHTM